MAAVRDANWPHFPAFKKSFPATDYAGAGRMMFDIGGNNYRLLAPVDFEEQVLFIERIITHAEYGKENR